MTTSLEAGVRYTGIDQSKSGERGKGIVLYVFVDPKAKSARARYIRVAVIDIIIAEGGWNICCVKG